MIPNSVGAETFSRGKIFKTRKMKPNKSATDLSGVNYVTLRCDESSKRENFANFSLLEEEVSKNVSLRTPLTPSKKKKRAKTSKKKRIFGSAYKDTDATKKISNRSSDECTSQIMTFSDSLFDESVTIEPSKETQTLRNNVKDLTSRKHTPQRKVKKSPWKTPLRKPQIKKIDTVTPKPRSERTGLNYQISEEFIQEIIQSVVSGHNQSILNKQNIEHDKPKVVTVPSHDNKEDESTLVSTLDMGSPSAMRRLFYMQQVRSPGLNNNSNIRSDATMFRSQQNTMIDDTTTIYTSSVEDNNVCSGVFRELRQIPQRQVAQWSKNRFFKNIGTKLVDCLVPCVDSPSTKEVHAKNISRNSNSGFDRREI